MGPDLCRNRASNKKELRALTRARSFLSKSSTDGGSGLCIVGNHQVCGASSSRRQVLVVTHLVRAARRRITKSFSPRNRRRSSNFFNVFPRTAASPTSQSSARQSENPDAPGARATPDSQGPPPDSQNPRRVAHCPGVVRGILSSSPARSKRVALIGRAYNPMRVRDDAGCPALDVPSHEAYRRSSGVRQCRTAGIG
jgi:hypothetical protein